MTLKSQVYLGCSQGRQSNIPWVMCTRPLSSSLGPQMLTQPCHPWLLSVYCVHLHGCALLSMVSWGTNHSKAILQMIAVGNSEERHFIPPQKSAQTPIIRFRLHRRIRFPLSLVPRHGWEMGLVGSFVKESVQKA